MKKNLFLFALVAIVIAFSSCKDKEESKYTLTISVAGDGIVLVNDKEYKEPLLLDAGKVATLEARPGPGWEFDTWSGDLSSKTTSEPLVIDKNISVTATFFESATGTIPTNGDTPIIPTDPSVIAKGKADIEASGIEMIQHMKEFMNTPGVEAIEVFTYYLNQTYSKSKAVASPFFKPVAAISSMKAGNPNPKVLFKAMNAPLYDPKYWDDDEYWEPESIKEIFDEFAGSYEWNSTFNDWDYFEVSDKIEFKFPATETGTSNNASIVLTYQGTTSVPSQIDGYYGDMPVELKITCTSAGTKVMEYTLNFEYNAEGVPTKIVSRTVVSNFTFETQWNYSLTNASITYSMKKGTQTLMDMSLAVVGDLTIENAENAYYPDDFLSSANAHFQLMDIKIVGSVDIVAVFEAERTIYESVADPIQADTQMAEAINDNMSLVVAYANTMQPIAHVEAYQYMYTDEWYDWWDDEVYTEEVSTIGMRFKFGDDSTADMETYFGSGFDDLIIELENFIEDMFGQFDLNFDDDYYW